MLRYVCTFSDQQHIFQEHAIVSKFEKSAAILHKFLDKAQQLTDKHCLKANTKQELLSITMQYSETVIQYY